MIVPWVFAVVITLAYRLQAGRWRFDALMPAEGFGFFVVGGVTLAIGLWSERPLASRWLAVGLIPPLLLSLVQGVAVGTGAAHGETPPSAAVMTLLWVLVWSFNVVWLAAVGVAWVLLRRLRRATLEG